MEQELRWQDHIVRAGPYRWSGDVPPVNPSDHRKHIEPWLAALLQAEHLNLLIGSGLTLAIAKEAGASAPTMNARAFQSKGAEAVEKAAKESALRCGRGEPNVEDQIRVALELIGGLRILAKLEEDSAQSFDFAKKAAQLLKEWEEDLDRILQEFLTQILNTESEIKKEIENGTDQGKRAARFLGSFLLTFASRAASRDRLHIFTTNYDRLIEYGCDLLGLRIVDRFVGQLSPVFRSSRLSIDLHYNPPGLHGEPRYLEGVIRLTKLHGSIDWRQEQSATGHTEIRRCAIPFGADTSNLPLHPKDNVMIYPNPAKDVETLQYPYAELFRDFAAAVCQPNELSPTVLSQCNTFLLHRIVNDRDQDLVKRLVPDGLTSMLRELPSLPSRRAILLGWAAPAPVLVEIQRLPEGERPHSQDPAFWDVWTGDPEHGARSVDWNLIAQKWTENTVLRAFL